MYILYLYCPVEIILILGILDIIRVSYSCGFNKSSLSLSLESDSAKFDNKINLYHVK